jgi:hypothetical protein
MTTGFGTLYEVRPLASASQSQTRLHLLRDRRAMVRFVGARDRSSREDRIDQKGTYPR